MRGLWAGGRPLKPLNAELTEAIVRAHAPGRPRPRPTVAADPQGEVCRLLKAGSNRPQRRKISLPNVWSKS